MHPADDADDADGDGRSMRERMEAGDPYIADDPELAAMARRAAELMHAYNHGAGGHDTSGQDAVLRELVASVGADTVIRAPFFVDYGSHITFGARTFDSIASVQAAYRERWAASRRNLAGRRSDDIVDGRGARPVWALELQVLRELAQHVGHAEILHEQILAARSA